MNPSFRPTPPSASDFYAIELVCHPATPCAAHFKLEVQWGPKRVANGWVIQLTYAVMGEVQQLRLPKLTKPGAADGLWAHTCFEAFFSEPVGPAYREFNFSPSTQWAHYRFVDERTRDPVNALRTAPGVHAPNLVGQDRLLLTASVAATQLRPDQADTFFAPTAVLELTDGSLSYWAVDHPAPKPDFHARTGWNIPQGWAID